MRKGFVWALIVSLAFGVTYFYYSGLLEGIFFPNPLPKVDIKPEKTPILAEKDVIALIEVLRRFPKSEDYLKNLKAGALEMRDPFLLSAEPPVAKVEVKLDSQVGLVVEVPPPMKLEGIVDVGSKKIAVLQIGDEKGIVLAQGEKRGDVKVVKIERGRVVISWKNQLRFLELGESR